MSFDIAKYPTLALVDSTQELRLLPKESLPKLCDELRRYLLDSVSRSSGHFASGLGTVELTVALARETGVCLVASFHNFHETPPAEALVAKFAAMEKAGADVVKIAVMPQSPRDVLTLLGGAPESFGLVGIFVATPVIAFGIQHFKMAQHHALTCRTAHPKLHPAAEVLAKIKHRLAFWRRDD